MPEYTGDLCSNGFIDYLRNEFIEKEDLSTEPRALKTL
jgi:hypothetical protein